MLFVRQTRRHGGRHGVDMSFVYFAHKEPPTHFMSYQMRIERRIQGGRLFLSRLLPRDEYVMFVCAYSWLTMNTSPRYHFIYNVHGFEVMAYNDLSFYI